MGYETSAGVQRKKLKREKLDFNNRNDRKPIKRMLELTLIIPIQTAERKMQLTWGLPCCCQCLSILFNERNIFFNLLSATRCKYKIYINVCDLWLCRNQKQSCLQYIFCLERETAFQSRRHSPKRKSQNYFCTMYAASPWVFSCKYQMKAILLEWISENMKYKINVLIIFLRPSISKY